MADLEIPLLDPDEQVYCSDCKWTGKWNEAKLRIADFASMVSVARNIPAGQCPKCNELVYLAKQHSVGNHGLTYTAKTLFPLFCDLQSGLVKLMAEGVINSENMGDNWNWIKTTIEKIEMKENEVLVSELEPILDDE